MKIKSTVKAGAAGIGGRHAFSFVSCFVAGTRIRCADGDEFAVEDLARHAPLLRRADGSEGTIARIKIGFEGPLVCHLTSETGVRIGVTAAHPVVVRRSGLIHLVAAEVVEVGDEVPTIAEGTLTRVFTRIGAVERRRYSGLVYNFFIERSDRSRISMEEHLVIANGVVTGENTLQVGTAGHLIDALRWAGRPAPERSTSHELLGRRLDRKYRVERPSL